MTTPDNGADTQGSADSRRFSVPTAFTNYDLNPASWGAGNVDEVFEQAATAFAREALEQAQSAP